MFTALRLRSLIFFLRPLSLQGDSAPNFHLLSCSFDGDPPWSQLSDCMCCQRNLPTSTQSRRCGDGLERNCVGATWQILAQGDAFLGRQLIGNVSVACYIVPLLSTLQQSFLNVCTKLQSTFQRLRVQLLKVEQRAVLRPLCFPSFLSPLSLYA